MYVIHSLVTFTLLFLIGQKAQLFAQPVTDELSACEDQLSKYRRFLLQAILSFEDVCDAYDAHPLHPLEAFYRQEQQESANPSLPQGYQVGSAAAAAAEQRSEIWAFFKLLMAQFNDVDFVNIIKEAVIERCRMKSQLQHDEKRNSVVLGKKQRFHSWGGKRSHFGTDERNLDLL